MFSRPSLAKILPCPALALCALLASCTLAPNGSRPVAQATLGENACGPCAVLNALKFGGFRERATARSIKGFADADRVRTIIEEFGTVPSDVYPERPRYQPSSGMCNRELLGLARDIAAAGGLRTLAGAFLDRASDTPPGVHLGEVFAKLRRSLDAGFPPIVLIRSFAAVEKTNATGYEWSGLAGHWVTVVSLPDKLPAGAVSFTMRVADSETGAIQEAFVCEELVRNFTAAKGDDIRYTWPSVPRPFLAVHMPILPFRTDSVPWYLRTNVVLSYAIFREPGAPMVRANKAFSTSARRWWPE